MLCKISYDNVNNAFILLFKANNISGSNCSKGTEQKICALHRHKHRFNFITKMDRGLIKLWFCHPISTLNGTNTKKLYYRWVFFSVKLKHEFWDIAFFICDIINTIIQDEETQHHFKRRLHELRYLVSLY